MMYNYINNYNKQNRQLLIVNYQLHFTSTPSLK